MTRVFFLSLSLSLSLSLVACGDDPAKITEDTADSALAVDEDGDGWTVGQGDCQDNIDYVNPGAEELPCDGIDNDCDGVQDNDADGDGYDCQEWGGDDCDDADSAVHPGAEDECGDGLDMDCDGDGECDCDGDGYESGGCGGEDCDDTDDTIYPGAEDACYDDIDSDCWGGDEFDCDEDGFQSAEFGGDDCDDADAAIYPGAGEICMDDIDNDCDASTSDCDCDEDGYDAVECGGDDCDDNDEAINPDASEGLVNGQDDDCDDEIDEDAYCNLYAPLSNGSSAQLDYAMYREAVDYTETITLSTWDATSGEAVVVRSLVDGWGLTQQLNETWTCDPTTGVAAWGFEYYQYGSLSATVAYSNERVFLQPEGSMVPGYSWTYAYETADATWGSLWSAEGTYTVVGTESVTVTAGTFDALVITNEYVTTDLLGGGSYDYMGTVTMYYVPKLGLVYSEDIDPRGQIFETRELLSYSGYYPE